jgi:hypothetical protein
MWNLAQQLQEYCIAFQQFGNSHVCWILHLIIFQQISESPFSWKWGSTLRKINLFNLQIFVYFIKSTRITLLTMQRVIGVELLLM